MKKLKFKYEGKVVTMEEATHAALFRTFFDYWKEKDLEKAIVGTLNSGLRISKVEFFEGTVIKKKNLNVANGLWVITHITPAAMDKGILGFLAALDVEVIEPKPKAKTTTKNTPKKTEKPKVKEEPIDEEENEDEEDEELEDDDTEDEEDEEEEIEAVTDNEILKIAKMAAKGGKKTSTIETMQNLVDRKMAERDAEIKARLAKGPQKKAE